MQRGAGKRHEACAGGFEDAEVGDEFEEGVNAGRLCGSR